MAPDLSNYSQRPSKLWVPASSIDPDHGSGTVVHPVRFRRSLFTATYAPLLLIPVLWLIVHLDKPAERADTAILCGTVLALSLGLLVAVHLPGIDVTRDGLRYFVLPRVREVAWADVRSVSVGSAVYSQPRLAFNWVELTVHDPARGREVRRNVPLSALPSREFLIALADRAEVGNPGLGDELRDLALTFKPAHRLHFAGTRPAAFWCGGIIAAASAVVAVVAAL